MSPKTYDWETCAINTNEWARMIERRNEKNWRMVSVSAIANSPAPDILAYVFWESDFPLRPLDEERAEFEKWRDHTWGKALTRGGSYEISLWETWLAARGVTQEK